jgi:23S rRNA (cytidine1920-2'-O)/16S rRNA (cytidine1409-2'-O)-methyltransferase
VSTDQLSVAARARVGRGAFKLEAALDAFALQVDGWVCADVGASTGGFTEVLLERGARRVYAIDVGYGQLAWRLRQDSRVVVMERTNARTLASLPEAVRLAVVDVSFISLRLILPAVRRWLARDGEAVALAKPQFEAGRGTVGRGGVIRDQALRRSVLDALAAELTAEGWERVAAIDSPIAGASGNLEQLWHLRLPGWAGE